MRTATKTRCQQNRSIYCCAILLALISSSTIARAADFFVDLTSSEGEEYPPIEHRFNSAMKLVQLPLELTIQSTPPLSVVNRDRFEMEIRIRNTGQKPVLIPVSKRRNEVLKAGSQDRRLMYLGLKVTSSDPENPREPLTSNIDFTVGSSDVPGSMIVLAPNDSVVIRMAGQLGGTLTWRAAGSAVVKANIKASLLQSFVDDKDLAVTNNSVEVVSTNSADLTLTWQDISVRTDK